MLRISRTIFTAAARVECSLADLASQYSGANSYQASRFASVKKLVSSQPLAAVVNFSNADAAAASFRTPDPKPRTPDRAHPQVPKAPEVQHGIVQPLKT